jgi:hypothetical protein
VDMFDGDAGGRRFGAASGVSRRKFLRAAGAVGLAATAGTAAFSCSSCSSASAGQPVASASAGQPVTSASAGQPVTPASGELSAAPTRAAHTTEGAPGGRAGAGGAHNFLGSYEGPPGRTTNQWFKQISAVVPRLNGFRQYDNQPFWDNGVWRNRLAPTWPAPPYPGYVGPSVFSIYPVPSTILGPLFSPKFSPKNLPARGIIEELMASAPPNSYLSAWHEFGTINYRSFGVTAANLALVHLVLNDMAKSYPNVTYGPILFTPKDRNSLVAAFESCPPDMGFYGVDVYGNNGTSAGLQQLENFINLAKGLDTTRPPGHGYPKLLIAETNTPLIPPLCSPEPCTSPTPAPRAGPPGTGWFESVCTRMHKYGSNSIGVLTFWKESGPLSGPWDPGHDGTTAAALRNCIDIFNSR